MQMETKIPTMIGIKETAQRTGLAEHYIRQLCINKKIVRVRCGKKYLVNLEKFIDYLNYSDNQEKEEVYNGTE